MAACLATGVGATEETAKSALTALLADIDTLSAEVKQQVLESDGGVLEESDVVMHLWRPDKFYWETVEPFPELIVTDGETLWNYQPDLEQVVVEPWDRASGEFAARLLSGDIDSIAEEFDIGIIAGNDIGGGDGRGGGQDEGHGGDQARGKDGTQNGGGQDPREYLSTADGGKDEIPNGGRDGGSRDDGDSHANPVWQLFTLVPRGVDSPYREIRVAFAAGVIESIYVGDRNGERTVWLFDAVRRNEALAATLFEFLPPPGIEVVVNAYGDDERP